MVKRQLSFAHAIKAIKLAIVKESYPSDRLFNDDFYHVQVEILRRIDMTPLESHMPRILRTLLQAGTIIIYCNAEGTGNELEGFFQDSREVISDATLKVISASDLPNL